MLMFLEDIDPLTKWKDPYPDPVIEEYDGIQVVRDDLLTGGSKQRFADFLLSSPNVKEWVYGSSPATGYAQVALAAACQVYGKKAVLFMANRSPAKRTNLQNKALSLGADIHWVDNGMLTVTEKRARDYVAQNPVDRCLIPIGFDHPTVIESIRIVASKIPEPKEVWTVGSSGTLTRGLQLAWPNADFHCVRVGHMGSYGKAKIYVSDLAFDKPVKDSDMPPFPSAPTYDAKAWKFIKQHASPGALFWNVGS